MIDVPGSFNLSRSCGWYYRLSMGTDCLSLCWFWVPPTISCTRAVIRKAISQSLTPRLRLCRLKRTQEFGSESKKEKEKERYLVSHTRAVSKHKR